MADTVLKEERERIKLLLAANIPKISKQTGECCLVYYINM